MRAKFILVEKIKDVLIKILFLLFKFVFKYHGIRCYDLIIIMMLKKIALVINLKIM